MEIAVVFLWSVGFWVSHTMRSDQLHFQAHSFLPLPLPSPFRHGGGSKGGKFYGRVYSGCVFSCATKPSHHLIAVAACLPFWHIRDSRPLYSSVPSQDSRRLGTRQAGKFAPCHPVLWCPATIHCLKCGTMTPLSLLTEVGMGGATPHPSA